MIDELAILVSQTVLISIPLVLCALGGALSERSGIVNIALEAMLLSGAFGAAIAGFATGSALIGIAGGVLAGALIAALHAVLTIAVRADHIIAGLALNILAAGATEFGAKVYWSADASRNLPPMPDLPIVGRPLIYVTFGLVALIWYVQERTVLGLRWTAAGENPEACTTAGLSVRRLRATAVIAAGALAGLGGSWLALNVGQFQHGMSAGKGYIALAAVVFGRWRAGPATLACLLFAASEALAAAMERWEVRVPSELVGTLPYVLTIIAVTGFVGRSRAPAALGQR